MGEIVDLAEHRSSRLFGNQKIGGDVNATALGDIVNHRTKLEGDAVVAPLPEVVRLDFYTFLRKRRQDGVLAAQPRQKFLMSRHADNVGIYFRDVNSNFSVASEKHPEHDWNMASDETEREFRRAVGRRFRQTRIALGYADRPALARLFVSKPDEVTALADRIRQWEDGKALVQPYFLRQLRMRHGVTHDWIFEGDASRLPHDLADLVLRSTG